MLDSIVQFVDWVTLTRQKKIFKPIHSQLRELRTLTWFWIDAKQWYPKDIPKIQFLIQQICESLTTNQDGLFDAAAKIAQCNTIQSNHYFRLFELLSRARQTPNFDVNKHDQKYWNELIPLAFNWLSILFKGEKFEMNFEQYKLK